MSVLDRYIVRTVLGSVGMVMAVVVVLGGLFVFISQQSDIGVGHYTVADALWYTLLNLPQQVYELLPITTLIGSLLGFGQRVVADTDIALLADEEDEAAQDQKHQHDERHRPEHGTHEISVEHRHAALCAR